MPPRPHVGSVEHTAITIGYTNKAYIADEVLNRIPVGLERFTYNKMEEASAFDLPDTRIGRKTPANEVEFRGVEVEARTEAHGLQSVLPLEDIANNPGDLVGITVEWLTGLVLLGRELRVSKLVFDPNIYPASNRITLAGGDQWSNFDTSDPIEDILAALDAPLMRPNNMVIGQSAWSVLSRHPKIMKSINGTAGDSGLARREQVAELFELDAIHVGKSRLNAARKGQPMNLTGAWGGHCSVYYRGAIPSTDTGATFGFTAAYEDRAVTNMFDSKIGAKGAQRVKVVEQVKEVIASGYLGYFIQNAI